MARRHTPLQQYKEACQIARDHGLLVVECKTKERTDYVVYRDHPGAERRERVGKRSSVAALRLFVARLAGPTHH